MIRIDIENIVRTKDEAYRILQLNRNIRINIFFVLTNFDSLSYLKGEWILQGSNML